MPEPVVVVDGQTPAPPPIIRELAASNPLEARVVVAVKHATPPLVPPVVVSGNPMVGATTAD